MMSDAGIEDLSNNPTSNAEGVISEVEKRFKLDLTDEQAERFFVQLIRIRRCIDQERRSSFPQISVARR